MADIQFDINLDLVEKYVPAENVTVVQEDFQSVKFRFTITNREQPVDLTGATNIVVSFVKPDGHLVLQNDATLVNGKVELVANPQAFTYVGKTYFQVQYKIGSSIYNTRQAFLWVEKGHTSCQTVSSTDFAPMLDQAIQAGQMLSGIDLQALIDSKVTAENAQKDVDNLEIRVGALEVTIVGLSSKVSTLEATATNHETRIGTLEANYPNLSPIEADITALKTKNVEQDGRIGANELAISVVQTKNTQQDTVIAGNATAIANLQAKDTAQDTRMTAIENKNTGQDDRLSAIETKNTSQDTAISALQSSQATQDTKISAIETKNTQQDTAISANAASITTVDNKVVANKTAQDAINTSTAGSIANHTSRITTLETDSTTDNARITNLEMDNSSNKTRISATEGAIGVLNTDINALQGSDAIQTADIVAIKTKNTQQDTAISDNSAAITANKTDADAKITGLSTRVGTAETDIAGLKTKDAQQDTRMTAIENKNDAQDTRMTTIEGVNTAQNTRLTDIENKNTSQDTAIAGKVSKAGDTMTGDLSLDRTGTVSRDITYRKDGASQISVGVNSANKYRLYDWINDVTAFEYDTSSKSFNVLQNTNLLKKTGDTMTGHFYRELGTSQDARIAWTKDGSLLWGFTSGEDLLRLSDWKNGKTVFDYIGSTNTLNVNANTNLMKKTGDTMTGNFGFERGSGERSISWYKSGVESTKLADNDTRTMLYSNDGNEIVWTYEKASKTFEVRATNTNLVTKTKDGRASLTLTADATAVDSNNPPIAIRRGNTVTFRCYMQRKVGSASNLMTTLPIDMRPIDTIFINALGHDGTVCRVTIGTDGNVFIGIAGNTSTEGKQLAENITFVVN